MRLLLDTHALLWWRDDDRTLGSSARALIADPANDVSISVVSLWEIVTKCRAGKLPVGLSELYQVALSLTHAPSRPKVRLGEERKQFFFEKKNQKTFDYKAFALPQRVSQIGKSFCFPPGGRRLFSKRSAFLLSMCQSQGSLVLVERVTGSDCA